VEVVRRRADDEGEEWHTGPSPKSFSGFWKDIFVDELGWAVGTKRVDVGG
jgi:hypothetical protein